MVGSTRDGTTHRGAPVLSPEEKMSEHLMRTAISALAETPVVFPNPRVACIIADEDGNEIARGIHPGAGQPHAEVFALRAAGERAKGATAIVTMEPCNHTGRTGPCSQALIDAGIKRVVFAQHDPNPQAAGGAETLRAAGIEVIGGVLEEDSRALNREWTFSVVMKRPFVTWKYAATLDGRIAASDGTSRWISSEASRTDTHLLRARCDAIAVGTGTWEADQPALNVRLDNYTGPQPLRVVLGMRDIAAPDDVLHIRSHDPQEILETLAAREIRHLLIEGGPKVAGAFLNASAIDEVIAYFAPALMGAGMNAIEGRATTLADMVHIDIDDVIPIGPDLRITGRPVKEIH